MTIVRGLLAIMLGLALVIHPDKTRPILVNFMGIFWLASGFMSVRWGATGHTTRRFWPIFAGVAGIIAGLLALTRRLTAGILTEFLILHLLGAVIILTGVIHITGGFRFGHQERHRIWASILLGAFEIILGALAVMARSFEFGPFFYWALAIWALLGGFLLLADALAMRRRARQAYRQEGRNNSCLIAVSRWQHNSVADWSEQDPCRSVRIRVLTNQRAPFEQ